jgi:hypothetical protein
VFLVFFIFILHCNTAEPETTKASTYIYIYKRNIYLYHIIDIYTHMQATYGIVSAFLATAVHFRWAPLHAPKPMRPKTPPVCSDAPAGLGRKIKESEVIHNGIGVSVCP